MCFSKILYYTNLYSIIKFCTHPCISKSLSEVWFDILVFRIVQIFFSSKTFQFCVNVEQTSSKVAPKLLLVETRNRRFLWIIMHRYVDIFYMFLHEYCIYFWYFEFSCKTKRGFLKFINCSSKKSNALSCNSFGVLPRFSYLTQFI